MLNELETVVLTHDIPEFNLKTGDIGVVVHAYAEGTTFEVEFVTAEGRTVALLTLNATDLRQMGSKEILHVRELSAA